MRVITAEEYLKKKKKGENIFDDDIAPVRSNNGVVDIRDLVEMSGMDIKDINKTVDAIEQERLKNKRTWFNPQKTVDFSAFDDGWQFGDLTKSIGKSALNQAQTTIGSLTDVYQDVMKGGQKLGEGVIDTGAYLLGGGAKILGQDEFADKTKKFIARDLVGELGSSEMATHFSPIGLANNIITGNLDAYSWDNYKKYATNNINLFDEDYKMKETALSQGKSFEENSLLGDKSDALIQSAGQLASTMALQSVGVPWFLTTGVSSFGRETEQAFGQGATYGEAGISGLISAGAEILTEKLSGGISFGGKTLDAGLKDILTKNIADKTVKTLVKLGFDAVGEGTEEVISEVFSRVGQKLTYEDEKTWQQMLVSEEAMDSYLESFIGGAVMGGGFNVGKATNSIKTGRDYDTGLTTNEQLVLDKEIEARVKEASKDGKKLSNKELSKIREEAKLDLQKGNISTGTIESTLGGETFKNLQKQKSEVESIKKQIKELEGKKMSEMSVGEYNDSTAQIKSLREKLKGIDTNTLESKLNSEMEQLTGSDNYLQRSYYEKAQRGVNFQADLSKYDAKQQEIVKKAIDSGILNNTTKTHEFVDMVAKLSADKGVSFDFTNNKKLKGSSFAVKGKTVNGFVNENGDITVNIDSNKALNSVVGHEITHILEADKELHKVLKDVVKNYAITKGEYQTRLEALQETYKGIKGANIENELTADLIGDYLFTDTDFVNQLSVEKPNLFQKIYNEIKYLVKIATAGSKEARELEKVKKAFEDAYRESGKQTKQQSIKDNKKLYKYTKENKMLVSATDNLAEILESGVFDAKRTSVGSYDKGTAISEYGKYRVHLKPEALDYVDKMYKGDGATRTEYKKESTKTFDTVEEMVYNNPKTSTGQATYDEFTTKNDIPTDLIEMVEIPEGTDQSVIDMLDSKGIPYEFYTPKQKSNTNENDLLSMFGKKTQKESTTDNQGRELSKEQKDFFKDSKVRDRDGNLLTMYHGTRGDFNVFDKAKAGQNYEGGWSMSGKGFYFASESKVAKDYAGASINEGNTNVKEVYLNVKNPFYAYEDYSSELAHLKEKYPIDDSTLRAGYRLIETLNQNGIDSTEVLREAGFDGVIESTRKAPIDQMMVFDSNQIKNVKNKKPTASEDIRYSLSEDNIKEVSTGYSSDEYFYEMQYIEDGKIAGTLNYGEYNGEPNVKMIEVKPEYQRKGIGTKLLQKLQNKYNGIEIDFGMSTPDGTKLLEKATYTVEDTEVVEKQNRIDEIQKILDEYDKGYENYFDNDLPIPENYAEDYNELYDEMRKLQEEIRGKSTTKRFVKTDNTKYSLSEDTQGRKLSDNQKEYFKNTEIVDKEGKLKVVYHGTPFGDFTTFKGKMFFFSEDYRFADDYANSKSFEQGLDGDIKVVEAYLKAGNVFDATDSTDIQKLREALPNEITYWGNTWDKETLLKKLQRKDTLPPKWKSEQLEGKQFGDYLGDDRNGYNTDMFVGVNEQNEIVYISQERGLQQLTQAEKTYLEEQLMSGNEVTYTTYQTPFGELTKTQIQERISELKKQGEEYKKDTGYENESVEYAIKLLNDSLERIEKNYYIEETKHKLTPKTTTQEATELDDIDNWTYFETAFDRETGKDVVDIIKDLGYDAINIYENGISNYIVFNPNQIKNVDNLNPTDNPDINMSLSNKNDIAPVRNNNLTYGEDVRIEAPINEEIAKLSKQVEDLSNKLDKVVFGEDVTAEEMDNLRQSVPYDDVAPIRSNLTADESSELDMLENLPFDLDTDSQIRMEELQNQENTIDEMPGIKAEIDRSVEVYKKIEQDENLKPFYQQEAEIMLAELQNTIKGERILTGDTSQFGSANEQQWIGIKRQTSSDIAELLDSYGYSYKQIEAGLKRIIEDKSYSKASKDILNVLESRLLDGYTTMEGYEIPANESYVNYLTESEIAEYYSGIPTEYASETTVTEDIAPVGNEPMLPADNPQSGDGDIKQRKWVETSTESDVVNREILPDDLDERQIYYQVKTNAKTLETANNKLGTLGYEKSVEYFNNQLMNKRASVEDIALGERLIQEAIKKGDKRTASELIQNVAILGTELGQKVQALSIIKRMTPEGQLRMLDKTIRRAKVKEDVVFKDVELTQEMKNKILDVYNKDGSYDQDELNRVIEEVKQEIANQMPTTAIEKVNAWRYLSMLGNPKTHIRNLVSNVAMKGTLAVKNAMARTIESVVPIKDRTKTWKKTSDVVNKFADDVTLEMKDIINGDSKYSEEADIKAKRDTFKNKVLNGVYNFNSNLLEAEDWWFSKSAFKNSFKEYLTANGIETELDIESNPEIVEKAKNYALEQSQIATFRQYSWLANKIRDIENKNAVTQVAVGSVIPFKKTPINIAKAGLSYSPLGFAKTLTYDIAQVKQGKMEASTLIDHLAQNTTGTALTLIGFWLASAGFLNGAGEDDKEGKYDYQLGEQAYSITIDGHTYSLSWLSPVAMPLFVGTNAYEQLVEGKELDGNVIVETLAQTLDPLSEMSFLSGLDQVLSSYDSGMEKFAGIFESMGQNYITQFIPTLSSQVASTFDDTKRSTKASGDSGFKFGEETYNKIAYKIPGLRNTLEPSTDVWGNEVKQSENVVERAFDNFLAPYSRREIITTDIDYELKDLYAETGENGLIPNVPSNYVNYKNEKYKMSAEEYTNFKKTYGQTSYDLLEDLFATNTYQNAKTEDKVDMVEKVYDYARDTAKKEYLEGKDVEYTNATKDNQEYYKENSIKEAIKNDVSIDEMNYAIKNPSNYAVISQIDSYENYLEYKDAIDNIKEQYKSADGMTSKQKTALSNQRKRAVQDYIESLNLDVPQKIMLQKMAGGYSVSSYKNYMFDYIENLPLSAEEKRTIHNELFD